MIRERPERLQSVEAVQVLLFTGGVSCGSAAVCRRCGLPLRLCRGDLPRCVPSAMQFCRGACLRFTPAVCLLTNRTACGMLRSYTAGSRSPFARSRDVGAVIGRGGNAELVCAAMRFRCGVLYLVHVRYTVLLRRFVFDHACCLSFDKQDGLRNVAFLFRRVEIAGSAFSSVVRLSGFLGSLRVWPFVCGDLDGIAGDTGDAGNGATGGWRRGLYALLRNHIGFAVLSAGSTLGLRAPDCAKESSTLWTLFRGWPSGRVRFTRRGCVGANTHPCKKRKCPISAPTRAKPGYMERPDRL